MGKRKGVQPGRLTPAGPVTITKADGTVIVQPARNKLGGVRPLVPPDLAQAVYARDGRRCRYCGKRDGRFELDHVVPVSRGGRTTLKNLVVACVQCNRKKHTAIWKPRPLRQHRQPHYLSQPPKVRRTPPEGRRTPTDAEWLATKGTVLRRYGS